MGKLAPRAIPAELYCPGGGLLEAACCASGSQQEAAWCSVRGPHGSSGSPLNAQAQTSVQAGSQAPESLTLRSDSHLRLSLFSVMMENKSS